MCKWGDESCSLSCRRRNQVGLGRKWDGIDFKVRKRQLIMVCRTVLLPDNMRGDYSTATTANRRHHITVVTCAMIYEEKIFLILDRFTEELWRGVYAITELKSRYCTIAELRSRCSSIPVAFAANSNIYVQPRS